MSQSSEQSPRRAVYLTAVAGCACFALAFMQSAVAAPPAQCKKLHVDGRASEALQPVETPAAKSCNTHLTNGFPVPDPNCTPGAINPSLTLETMQKKTFTTKCLRDVATSAQIKTKTYLWYNFKRPANNSGATQTCELDHLISLELGGADTLDNIWPQCGPKRVVLSKRYFKQKDMVENYLAAQVRAGNKDLAEVQKGIASDWTQYLEEARTACTTPSCR